MIEEEEVRNLAGILCDKDTELFRFVIEDGVLIDGDILCKDINKFPIEFSMINRVDIKAVQLFIKHRLTPRSRHRLKEDMQEAGLSIKTVDEFLRYNNGLSVIDDCWIKFEDGPQSYREVLAKAGYDPDAFLARYN